MSPSPRQGKHEEARVSPVHSGDGGNPRTFEEEASITHPRRFIRELTAASAFNTGLGARRRYGKEAAAVAAVTRAAGLEDAE